MLRNIAALKECLDLMFRSASDEESYVCCSSRFVNKAQQFDLVFGTVTFVKGVDDNRNGALERPALFGGRSQKLTELGREGFGKDSRPFLDSLLDEIAARSPRATELERDGGRKEGRFLSIAQPSAKEMGAINLSEMSVIN